MAGRGRLAMTTEKRQNAVSHSNGWFKTDELTNYCQGQTVSDEGLEMLNRCCDARRDGFDMQRNLEK